MKLLILLHYLVMVRCNLFFLAHDYNDDKYYCVTNSSTGLVWINDEKEDSIFIPQRVEKEIISYWKPPPPQIWSTILDRRWEKFDRVETSEKNKKPLYLNYSLPTGDNFKITFSVRVEKEADIFLCNDKDQLNCYWFLLKNSSKIILLKCTSSNISSIKKRCDHETIKEDYSLNYLSNNLWIHFEIIKENNNFISLNQIMGATRQKKIEFMDDLPIKISKLYVDSKFSRGFWKFHVKKPVMYTNKPNETLVRIDPPINNSLKCVNFFVAMCKTCQLKLNLRHIESSIRISRKVYTFQEPEIGDWNEISFYNDFLQKQGVVLSISTSVTNTFHEENPFWAIDDIRLCSSNELRIIATKNRKKCQVVNTNYTGIVSIEENDIINYTNKNLCKWDLYQQCAKLGTTEESICNVSPDFINKFYNYLCISKENTHNHSSALNTSFTLFVGNKASLSKSSEQEIVFIDDKQLMELMKNSTTVGPPTEKYTKKEIESPKQISINASSTHAQIFFPTMDPSRYFDDKLLVLINATCSTIYCHNVTSNFTYSVYSNTHNLTDLTPFQNYTLHINFCTSSYRKCLSETKSIKFSTKETVSKKIDNLLVYDKNATSITLCWTEPAPPTGISRVYKFFYSVCDVPSSTKTIKINQENCTVLDGNICITLNHLEKNQTYCIKIQPKNEHVAEFSEEISVRVRTTETVVKDNQKASEIPIITIMVILVILSAFILVLRRQCFVPRPMQRRDSFSKEENDTSLISLTNGYKSYESGNPILIKHFEPYLKESMKTGILLRQHLTIVDNVEEKKYETVDGDLLWDYVDWHLGQGGKIGKAYIVSSMPDTKNVTEFWRVVWKENVKNIIFVSSDGETNDFVSGEYFPKTENYDVYKKKDSLCGIGYEETLLELVFCQQKKEINLLHFFSWSRTDLPMCTALFTPILNKMLEVPLTSKSPIVLVSKSCIEASGLFLLCDMTLRHVKSGTIDIMAASQVLAGCNLNLISNRKIYFFAHLVILENLVSNIRAVNVANLNWQLPDLPSPEEIQNQWCSLNKLRWLDQTNKLLKEETACNSDLENVDHVYTYVDTLYPITLDGFRSFNKFITMQQPTQFSSYYFWKLVTEKNVSIIISLNKITSEEDQWWPSLHRPIINLSTHLKIQHVNTINLNEFTWVTAELQDETKRETVQIFLFENWTGINNCPDKVTDFVSFYDKLSFEMRKSVLTVIVTCRDGRKACGLYVALSLILDNIYHGSSCNIYSCVRKIQFQHQEFLKCKEQYHFLWKAIEYYFNEKQLYL